MRASRGIAAAALVLAAVVVVAVFILGSGSAYTITARFANAGEIVPGGTVDVGGTQIGSIAGVSLAPDGEASVKLSISDRAYVPLHDGTRAMISAPGLAGVDNRFVSLSPGPPSRPALRSGSVIASTNTRSLVNFDEVLDALDPTTRRNLQALFADGAHLYAGSGAPDVNRMLAVLDPALQQVDLTAGELSYDRAALRSLVQTAATTASAVASRAPDLTDAVSNTARTLGAVAVQRRALAGILTEAPTVLAQGTGTLHQLATTALALEPTLRDVPATARPLHPFLDKLRTTLRQVTPVATQLTHQLGPLTASFKGLTTLAPPTVAALHATGPALRTAMPILAGLRDYGSDFLLGVINGLGGISTGNYDAVGHYLRLELAQSYQTLPGGAFNSVFGNLLHDAGGSIFGLRTHIHAICPGGNEPPAADGSSPWIPNTSICNPADDMSASVNQP